MIHANSVTKKLELIDEEIPVGLLSETHSVPGLPKLRTYYSTRIVSIYDERTGKLWKIMEDDD